VNILDAGPCLLRPWREDDVDALVAIANNPHVARNLTHLFPHPYTQACAQNWISHTQSGTDPHVWAIETMGQLAGGIGLHRREGVFAHTGVIGYWLGEAFWGRGLASAALAAVCHHAFATLGLVRLEAAVFARNPASMRVLEKNGFQREGVLRKSIYKEDQYIDQVCYSRLSHE